MSKVTAIQKEIFRLNRNEMREENIQWAFCRETGVTIIYQVMPKGNFVKLSVAYCNQQDTFKKKIGLTKAFERWANGMAIQIPNVGHDGSADHAIEQFADLITCGNQFLEWPMD